MLKEITIRREGSKVLLLSGGVLICEMHWQKADELAKSLQRKARLAEEEEKATQIVNDSAILMRAGAPFSLSNRPDILKEAVKEAAWNRDLRRFMPFGVRSKEVFGVPTIIQHPPRKL